MNFSRLTGRISAFLWELKDNDRNPYYGDSRDELSLDRSGLDKISFDRLYKILDYAWVNSRHYRRRFAELGVRPQDFKSFDDLRRFPCLTRDDLRIHLDDLSAEIPGRSKWVKSATGGTTSSQISYYRDQPSTWRRWADTQAINAWYGYHVGDRVAYLWGAKQDFAANPSFGMRLRNSMYKRCLMLPSSPIDESIFDNYLEKLDRWRPSFLQAYTSSLHEFCRHLKTRNRRLPYLRGASVTAEQLYPHQRKEIEEVLGFKVFNWYGSRELGRVASECEKHEGLHINEPSVYVEVEQDPSLPDKCGHLIVTDLWNRATPMIRYRTGDIARLEEGECNCGRALKRISSLEGRLADTFILADGKRVNGTIMAFSAMSNPSEIVERQIIQKTHTHLHVLFVRGPEFSSSSLITFGDSLKRVLSPEISITFEQVSELPRERSGKIRFVKCEIEDSGGLISTSSGDQREDFHV